MTPGLERTQYRMVITGLYVLMNDEATVKRLIRDWRARTGVDKPVPETFIRKMVRLWIGKEAEKQGEIHCLVELSRDQIVYTAHFTKKLLDFHGGML